MGWNHGSNRRAQFGSEEYIEKPSFARYSTLNAIGKLRCLIYIQCTKTPSLYPWGPSFRVARVLPTPSPTRATGLHNGLPTHPSLELIHCLFQVLITLIGSSFVNMSARFSLPRTVLIHMQFPLLHPLAEVVVSMVDVPAALEVLVGLR